MGNRCKESYLCYMIYSVSTNRVYIGCTNDFSNRLHQHNSTKAGAKFTKYGRPWRCVAQVRGFPTQREAMQFEWAWQKFWRCRPLKELRECGKISASSRSLINYFKIGCYLYTHSRWAAITTCMKVLWLPKADTPYLSFLSDQTFSAIRLPGAQIQKPKTTRAIVYDNRAVARCGVFSMDSVASLSELLDPSFDYETGKNTPVL